jgi:hypothetical protein
MMVLSLRTQGCENFGATRAEITSVNSDDAAEDYPKVLMPFPSFLESEDSSKCGVRSLFVPDLITAQQGLVTTTTNHCS